MAEPNPNARLATEMHQKLEFYALGLTFGILALSVQTASWGGPLVARLGELAGWILFLVSGVTGLWRLEWSPKIYQLEGMKQDAEARRFEYQKFRAAGTRVVYVGDVQKEVPIEESIDRENSNANVLDVQIKKLDVEAIRKYRVQRWTLVLGLVALMVSRGYGPLMAIIADFRSPN